MTEISTETFRFAGFPWSFLGVCTPRFFVGSTEENSFARDLAVLFDIAILNAGTFITGASVRNFVFADLCAFEVFKRKHLPRRAFLRNNMINAAHDLLASVTELLRKSKIDKLR